jgi:hypothetical protein
MWRILSFFPSNSLFLFSQLLSGPYHDQVLFDDFNLLKGSALDEMFTNFESKENTQTEVAIEVVEALARHLVEEDSFTVAIHDAAKDSTVRF